MPKNKKTFYLIIVLVAVSAAIFITLTFKTKAKLNKLEEILETNRQTQEIIAYLEKIMPEIAETETRETKPAVSLEKFFNDLTILRADYINETWTKYFIVRPPRKTSSYIRQPIEMEIAIKKIFRAFLDEDDFYLDGIITEITSGLYRKEQNGRVSENLKKTNFTARIRFDAFSPINEETYITIAKTYIDGKSVKIKGTLKMPGWADSLEEIAWIFENEIFIEIDSAEEIKFPETKQ